MVKKKIHFVIMIISFLEMHFMNTVCFAFHLINFLTKIREIYTVCNSDVLNKKLILKNSLEQIIKIKKDRKNQKNSL
jgi:hypothetical protein